MYGLNLTTSYRTALELGNVIAQQHGDRYLPLLHRILDKIPSKEECIFSLEEESQLQNLLQLSPTQLQQFLAYCSYTFQQAAYYGLTTQSLAQELLNAGANSEQVAAFQQAWNGGSAALVKKLMSQKFSGNAHLESVDWRIQLQGIQSRHDKEDTKPAVPVALLELGVAPAEGKSKVRTQSFLVWLLLVNLR